MVKVNISIGNPLPKPLQQRADRAAIVVSDFLTMAQEQALIPDSSITSCKGLVFLSMIKAGYIWSGRFGSGLVVSRLEDGSWSAPSAISCLGVGYGAQAGIQFTDMVIILRDENSLNTFLQMGNLTFGAELALAVGPWGRSAEGSLSATCGLNYSFSKSKGLFGGLSLEGLMIIENRKTNERCYGKGASARKILSGEIPVNNDVAVLHHALNTRFSLASTATASATANSTTNTMTPINSSLPAGSGAGAAVVVSQNNTNNTNMNNNNNSSMYPAVVESGPSVEQLPSPPRYSVDESSNSHYASDDKAKLLTASDN